jgi:hypothetical protein
MLHGRQSNKGGDQQHEAVLLLSAKPMHLCNPSLRKTDFLGAYISNLSSSIRTGTANKEQVHYY